jgi:DNA polymerase-3 subunit epsilon
MMSSPDLELQDANFIAFDTETTGLYPIASRLLEIGATRFDAGGERIADFEQLINPEMPIPPEAQAVNHITDDMVRNQPVVEMVLPAFIDFLGSSETLLVAHNAPFDLEFIGVDMLRLGLALPRHMVFDTCLLAQALLPGLRSYRLEALAVVLGVSTPQQHRALSDAELTKDVLLTLLGRSPRIVTLADLAAVTPPLAFERVKGYQADAPAGLEALGEAIEARSPIEIVYVGGSKGTEPRKVTPRALLRCRGYVYLAAYCHLDGRDKMYRLDRIIGLGGQAVT